VLAELERDRDELRRDAFADEIAARPVHRLDADTRGLLVVARSRAAARALTRQWEHREVLKLYRATVYGDARGIDGWWEGAIGLPAAGRVREIIARAPDALGHDALTYARAVGSDDEFRTTTVLLSPWSGRTNQLRVHLAAMGFPIVGDDDHDRGPAGGAEGVTSRAVESGRALALAATHLELTHPFDGRRLRFALP
jgi:23S rRNA-/tRNA-specific pseudouridylate synthase